MQIIYIPQINITCILNVSFKVKKIELWIERFSNMFMVSRLPPRAAHSSLMPLERHSSSAPPIKRATPPAQKNPNTRIMLPSRQSFIVGILLLGLYQIFLAPWRIDLFGLKHFVDFSINVCKKCFISHAGLFIVLFVCLFIWLAHHISPYHFILIRHLAYN